LPLDAGATTVLGPLTATAGKSNSITECWFYLIVYLTLLDPVRVLCEGQFGKLTLLGHSPLNSLHCCALINLLTNTWQRFYCESRSDECLAWLDSIQVLNWWVVASCRSASSQLGTDNARWQAACCVSIESIHCLHFKLAITATKSIPTVQLDSNLSSANASAPFDHSPTYGRR